ncbi:MAG: hypothetical protein AB7V36_15050 [Bacteroidales bacterium]
MTYLHKYLKINRSKVEFPGKPESASKKQNLRDPGSHSIRQISSVDFAVSFDTSQANSQEALQERNSG